MDKSEIVNELKDILKILEGKKRELSDIETQMLKMINEDIADIIKINKNCRPTFSASFTIELPKDLNSLQSVELESIILEEFRKEYINPDDSGRAINMGVVF